MHGLLQRLLKIESFTNHRVTFEQRGGNDGSAMLAALNVKNDPQHQPVAPRKSPLPSPNFLSM